MIEIRCLKILLTFTFLISLVECSRNINCFVNPGFEDSDLKVPNTNVIHILSEGENDAVHYVWSTYKLPSVIVARTTKNTTLSINSTKLVSFEKDAILFENGKPLESVGVTFSKMWELHYDNDSSDVQDVLSAEDLGLDSFVWDNVNQTLSCSSSFASVALKAKNDDLPFSKGGSVQIRFSVSGDKELSDEFPHLVFTGNSTLLKFVFDNLYSNVSFTRYGFEITLFSVLSEECETDAWKKVITKSINDEFSPGVFSDVKLLAPCSDKAHEESSFIYWRPVAYTGVVPIVANSSDVNMFDNPQTTIDFTVKSIAELYFQDKSNASIFNVTFGTKGDGFYVATEYTSWSLMVGTGSVVEIPLSSSVIVFASVGIGLLALFLVAGSLFLLYQKCKKDRDDDLLLN